MMANAHLHDQFGRLNLDALMADPRFKEPNEADNFDWSDTTQFLHAMGMSRAATPSVAEARKQSKNLVNKIFDSFETLKAIVERHEATIQKRWAKWSKDRRKKILLTAWPNMPALHRPDFRAFRQETPEQREQGTRFRDEYLLPYINLEDLVHARNLLLFLKSRGRSAPHVFAHVDRNSGHLGYTSKAIIPAFLNEHTMMLAGQRTRSDYGRIYAWSDDDSMFDNMVNGIGQHPGVGLIILEIQDKIYGFLLRCCYEILSDIHKTKLEDDYTPQPEPELGRTGNEWPSLAAVAAETPYRVPEDLSFERLQLIVKAKQAQAEDHLWFLREDPGYFALCVMEESEHRPERILDEKGKAHSAIQKPIFWEYTIGNVLTSAYGSLLVWKDLHKQLSVLKTFQEKYVDKLGLVDQLPDEFERGMRRFHLHLEHVGLGPISNLKDGFPASPPCRSCWTRVSHPSTYPEISLAYNPSRDLGELMFLFQVLQDPQQLLLCGIENAVDELQRTISSDQKQGERISPWVASQIEDLGLVAELTRQLKSFQPWATRLEQYCDYKDELTSEYEREFAPLQDIITALKTSGISLESIGNPTDGRFYYPVDKKRNATTTDAMRAAERKLDIFWRKLDSHPKFNEPFQRIVPISRDLQRTSEWVAPQRPLRNITNNEDYFVAELERRTESTLQIKPMIEVREKIKSRAFANDTPAEREPIIVNLPTTRADVQPTFTLDKRALKVFSTLFYRPNERDQPGEIPWKDFLHAMSAVDFEIKKLYGSVWQFSPTNLDVEQPVLFHEPHPVAKIPFMTARRIGRRLFRNYGWTGDMFKGMA